MNDPLAKYRNKAPVSFAVGSSAYYCFEIYGL